MFNKAVPRFLLASPDPVLLTALEPVINACGVELEIVLSIEAALAAIVGPNQPSLLLLDETLPALDPRMNLGRLLAAARAHHEDSAGLLSIVTIADAVSQNWVDRLAEGVIDDLILRASEISYWRIRIQMVLSKQHVSRELETFREAAALNAQMDHLTGVFNRETILSMLFRETDRVQRMNGALGLVLLDIDDFGHWNSRLGNDACDDLLCQVAGRISRLMRSYDLLGRPGMDEFLLVLPGCSTVNATLLAERIRNEVFSMPFHVAGESIRLSVCCGIASSQGRSSVVVLREAEEALQSARAMGPESIQSFGGRTIAADPPFAFLGSSSGGSKLAW